MTNEQLEAILFPNKHTSDNAYLALDFSYIHKELAKPKVTLTLLWDEYRQKAEALGKRPYMPTQFGDKYRAWARITRATMRIHHKPGDAMEVDWAGQTLPIYDSVTGEESPAYLFIAVLPCSGYTYADATSDMKLENWLNCHVHAYEYFCGVTRLLIPDNLKIGVIKNTRYCFVRFSRSLKWFIFHRYAGLNSPCKWFIDIGIFKIFLKHDFYVELRH